jgi:hypothetical protein
MQVVARRWWHAGGGTQVVARRWWHAGGGTQVVARRWWHAGGGTQVVARRWWHAGGGKDRTELRPEMSVSGPLTNSNASQRTSAEAGKGGGQIRLYNAWENLGRRTTTR